MCMLLDLEAEGVGEAHPARECPFTITAIVYTTAAYF